MKFPATILLVCTFFSISFAESKPDSDYSSWTIKTPEEATAKALEYLGFLEMKGFSVEKNFDTARIVNINNDQTPFLHQYINNQDIWKVTFKDITLSPYRGYPDSVDYPRTIDVYIDPDNGTLLKIESLYAGTNIDFAPEPSIEWAEQMLERANQKCTSFVQPNNSYVSFYEILNAGSPPNFKQLKALLIMFSSKADAKPIPVWYITYRGTDPTYPFSRGVDRSDITRFNYRSYIYNAITGESMGNTIQPRIKYDFE